ncbi:unnamed protein product [Hymenolepis diminuta]|uniref:Uncharacterized protein n=2 Tax=Hymenolepis diminuta TaxID=6216 RepID=A0A564YMG1_HYMDI|nr:unnamed protein product [Hymenolepis diminuta]
MRQNSLVNEYRSQYAFNPLRFYSLSVRPRHQTKVAINMSWFTSLIKVVGRGVKAVGRGVKAVGRGLKAVRRGIKKAVAFVRPVVDLAGVVEAAKIVVDGVKATYGFIKKVVTDWFKPPDDGPSPSSGGGTA